MPPGRLYDSEQSSDSQLCDPGQGSDSDLEQSSDSQLSDPEQSSNNSEKQNDIPESPVPEASDSDIRTQPVSPVSPLNHAYVPRRELENALSQVVDLQYQLDAALRVSEALEEKVIELSILQEASAAVAVAVDLGHV